MSVGKTHADLMTCGIGHAHLKAIKIRFPVQAFSTIRPILAQGLKIPLHPGCCRQVCFFCHTARRKHGMKPAGLTFIKALAVFFRNIRLCKAQSMADSGSIPYLGPVFGLERLSLLFWLPYPVCGGIPEDTRKPTDPQCLSMNQPDSL